MKPPTISAVVTVYNAEQYIGQALAAILSQTHPPDEVIVVDDGSTDGTPQELARFRGEIRVLRQDNRGHVPALNRGMAEARGDYLAKCDADDIWDPQKLERQARAIQVHPEVDIAFGAARIFGEIDGRWAMPSRGQALTGVMDRRRFIRTMFHTNPICPSSTLIRRLLYERLGPFMEHQLVVEDYEYWMRALNADAVFYYDPSTLVHYRRHEHNVSSDALALHRSDYLVRSWNTDLPDSRWFVQRILARDLFHIARYLTDERRPREARAVLIDALRRRPTVRGLVWLLVLTAPEPCRGALAGGLVSIKRALVSATSR